jgi:two-component system nitrogen regulation sensor histidine kinase NtrY
MSLRTRVGLYFIAIHLPAAIFAALLFRDHGPILLIVEIVLAISLFAGAALMRAIFEPIELLQSGNDLIAEEDFTTRFRKLGHPELDRLIELYNAMLERLRDERLRSEEQQSLLYKIIDLSPTGIVMLDFDGRIQQMNPSAMGLMHADRSMIGRELESLPAPLRDIARVPRRAAQILPVDGRRRLRVWRGEFFDRGFTRDFFLIEELTEALRASEKAAYEKVIRMLSHEINNSIAAVSSLLESLLVFGERVGDQQQNFTRAIDIAANRLRSLDSFTRDFASVVRIPPPVPAAVDLEKLVGDVFTLHGPELRSRRIETSVAANDRAEVAADKNQLEQVIVNVVRNAIEAVDHDGRIDATIKASDGGVTLRIADSGSGLSPEVLQGIFTPFFTSKRNGRGLGLTMVHEILSNHDADFAIRNREEGGAEFVMTLRASADTLD